MRSLQDAHVFNWTLQYDMAGQAFPDYYGADAYPRNRLPRGRVLRASRDGAALAGAELLPALQAAAGADRTLEGYVADGVEERADGSVVVTASALGGGPRRLCDGRQDPRPRRRQEQPRPRGKSRRHV